jgi:hypothetical protein
MEITTAVRLLIIIMCAFYLYKATSCFRYLSNDFAYLFTVIFVIWFFWITIGKVIEKIIL